MPFDTLKRWTVKKIAQEIEYEFTIENKICFYFRNVL